MASQRKRRRHSQRRPTPVTTGANLDGTKIATTYQWSAGDQTRLAAAIFAAMKVAFEARWVELGLAGIPLPPAAVRHLTELSQVTATGAVRTHNSSVTRFIMDWLTAWAAAHDGSTAGAQSDLIDAVGAWLAKRVESHGKGLASFQTLQAHSLADLYSAKSGDLFTVVGPDLTDQSCAVCRHYYGKILTSAMAWQFPFPAHMNCAHTLQRLMPDEAERARAQGLIPTGS